MSSFIIQDYNIQKTTTVESIMNKDILCSDVVGLIGEPFEIETTSKFDKATLTYVIDKSKLGDTEFDNLLFLWYDEENDNFVEMDTTLDEENSTVSVETTHFSKYMIVDGKEWYRAWQDIYTVGFRYYELFDLPECWWNEHRFYECQKCIEMGSDLLQQNC